MAMQQPPDCPARTFSGAASVSGCTMILAGCLHRSGLGALYRVGAGYLWHALWRLRTCRMMLPQSPCPQECGRRGGSAAGPAQRTHWAPASRSQPGSSKPRRCSFYSEMEAGMMSRSGKKQMSGSNTILWPTGRGSACWVRYIVTIVMDVKSAQTYDMSPAGRRRRPSERC